MKKVIRTIWRIVDFPLLHFGMQILVSVWYIIIAAIIVGVSIGLSGEAFDVLEITEQLLARMNMTLIVVISSLATIILTFLFLRGEGPAKSVFRLNRLGLSSLAIILVLGVALNIFTVFALTLTEVTQYFPEYEDLINTVVGSNLILELLGIAILAPILEEIIYRGIVFGRLVKMTRFPVALILQALLFGIIHLNVLQGFYAFILGIVLGLVFYWTDSLWSSIALHIVYNLTSVVLSNAFEELEISDGLFIGIMCAALAASAALLVVLRRQRKKTAPVIL